MPITQQLLLNIPTFPLAIMVVGGSIFLTILTTLFSHYVVPQHKQKIGGALTVLIFGTNSIIYAILLAVILFSAWLGFENAQSNVMKEANCVVELYRSTEAFLPALKQDTRNLLEAYIHSVLNEEWKTLAKSELNPHTIEISKMIWQVYSGYAPKTAAEQVFLQESIRKLYELRECRAQRLQDSKIGIYPLLWFVLLVGEVATVFSFAFFTEHIKSKLLAAFLFGALVGLIFFTILLFDFPFTGQLTVSPDALRQVLLYW